MQSVEWYGGLSVLVGDARSARSRDGTKAGTRRIARSSKPSVRHGRNRQLSVDIPQGIQLLTRVLCQEDVLANGHLQRV